MSTSDAQHLFDDANSMPGEESHEILDDAGEENKSGDASGQPLKGGEPRTRRKSNRPIPLGTFRDALAFAEQVVTFGSGTPVRRISLLDHLGKGVQSKLTRDLISGTGQYGLISGNYQAPQLIPTPSALLLLGNDAKSRQAIEEKLKLAIFNHDVFKMIYETYQDRAFPQTQVIKDFLAEKGVASEWHETVVQSFRDNANFIGLLKVLSGAERLLTSDHYIEELTKDNSNERSESFPSLAKTSNEIVLLSASNQATETLADICFYVTPIGDEGSEYRSHSDLFFEHIVTPAVSKFNLTLIRADQISKPGMIGKQIVEHIVKSKLVIADLSFHNPNVFYELAIRHVCRKPTVQIIRQADYIPFDLNQFRTIKIDNTNIYTLIPKLDTYRAEIENQIRRALEEDADSDNPISTFFPTLRASLN